MKHDGVVVDGVSTCAGPESSAISRPGVERGGERMEGRSQTYYLPYGAYYKTHGLGIHVGMGLVPAY